jgi:anti-anti-sigma factor
VNLPITSVRQADGSVELSPRGEIDLDNAYLIREAVDRALVARPGGITVNLRLVKVIDSVGIGILVACFHAASASGVRLVLTNPSPTVYRQLWVAGLVGLFGLPTPAIDDGRPAAASGAR